MSNYEILDGTQHSQLRLRPLDGYSFASRQHLVSLVLHEFGIASAHYPIVFVKAAEEGKFMPVALLGLEMGKNLFVDASGQWRRGVYVPAAFRRYPFALVQTGVVEGAVNLSVCIDLESRFLGTEEGHKLFDEQGSPTQTLEKIREFLKELAVSEKMVEEFSRQIVELDLLVPGDLRIRDGEKFRQYDGCYVIDENRLDQLTDEHLVLLRQKGYLAPVYAHLFSLLRLQSLAEIQEF